MSRVLVTGSTGVIGQEVVERLSQGWDVTPTSRRAADTAHHRACDLLEPGPVEELLEATAPEVVVHLAGGAGRSAEELYARNALTTVNLMQAAARLESPPYFIIAGSGAEYGTSDGRERFDEAAPLRPDTTYGRAKLAQTTLAQAIAARDSVPLTVLRPFNVVSPVLPRSGALGNMRAQLLEQEGTVRKVECGRLDVIRDFVPVSFVAEVIAGLAAEPRPGETFNVCSGNGIVLGDLLVAMGQAVGAEVKPQLLPELAGIEAVERVVGDPTKLSAIGLSAETDVQQLAEVLLRP